MTAPAAVGWNRPHEMLTISIRTPSRNQNDLAAHSRCLRWGQTEPFAARGSNVAYGVGTGQSLNAERAASFRPRTLRTSQSGIGQPRAFSSAPMILGAWRMACISASATAGQIAAVTACRARRSARCAHNAQRVRCRRLARLDVARLPGGTRGPVSTGRAASCASPSLYPLTRSIAAGR